MKFKNENDIYSFWEKSGFFKADPTSTKKPYSILIPPPNLTGELHLGHAMQHSILDALARFKRLHGFDVLLLPGVDHAGILFEATLDRELFTLDPGPQKAVFEEFKTYFEKGLIYKGPYIVQWCPGCNTAIEDVEEEYDEGKEKLYVVRYLIDGGSTKDYIEIATARPETIFADSGIAVYQNHPLFEKFVGMSAINPLTGKH